jgi:hypothetical protein
MRFPQITQPQLRQQQQQQSSQNHGVPHVYHDYICHTSWNGKDDEDASTFTRKKTGGVSQPFPEKLHEMLTTVENTNESDIVTWLPHGRAFIVRRPKEFTDLIMPKYVVVESHGMVYEVINTRANASTLFVLFIFSDTLSKPS